jgi:hypothetical protein
MVPGMGAIGAVGAGEGACAGTSAGAGGGAGLGDDAAELGTITPAMLESGAHPAAPSCQPRSVAENAPSASFLLTSSIEYCPSCCPFRATCNCIEVSCDGKVAAAQAFHPSFPDCEAVERQ